jgi:hypothetical protein
MNIEKDLKRPASGIHIGGTGPVQGAILPAIVGQPLEAVMKGVEAKADLLQGIRSRLENVGISVGGPIYMGAYPWYRPGTSKVGSR